MSSQTRTSLAGDVFEIHIDLSKEDTDYFLAIFPVDSINTPPAKILNTYAKRGVQMAFEAAALRAEVAISGAMRWPWSEEACMVGLRPQFRI